MNENGVFTIRKPLKYPGEAMNVLHDITGGGFAVSVNKHISTVVISSITSKGVDGLRNISDADLLRLGVAFEPKHRVEKGITL